MLSQWQWRLSSLCGIGYSLRDIHSILSLHSPPKEIGSLLPKSRLSGRQISDPAPLVLFAALLSFHVIWLPQNMQLVTNSHVSRPRGESSPQDLHIIPPSSLFSLLSFFLQLKVEGLPISCSDIDEDLFPFLRKTRFPSMGTLRSVRKHVFFLRVLLRSSTLHWE